MPKRSPRRCAFLIFTFGIPVSLPFYIQTGQRQFTTGSRLHQNTNCDVNEFSRTIPPSRVLKHRSSSTNLRIEANSTERHDLAARFELSDISQLSADLTLMRATDNNIHVEGLCQTKVRQRCVRTNEDFDVVMEFPLYCVVRPVVPVLQNLGEDPRDAEEVDRTDHVKKERAISNHGKNLNEMDVMALQRILQTDIDEDILMEDEAIYAVDGLLDVGELVAQLFWLNLDPYPKKPGTDPVQRSITG